MLVLPPLTISLMTSRSFVITRIMWDFTPDEPKRKTIWICVSVAGCRFEKQMTDGCYSSVNARLKMRKRKSTASLAVSQNAANVESGPKVRFSASIWIARRDIGVCCLEMAGNAYVYL